MTSSRCPSGTFDGIPCPGAPPPRRRLGRAARRVIGDGGLLRRRWRRCRRARRRPTPPRPRPRPEAYAVGRRSIELIDPSRPTQADPTRDLPAEPDRTLPVLLLYPATGEVPASTEPADDAEVADGTFPLVVFSHGWFASGPAYEGRIKEWARAGYIVAAPTFPLSSGAGGMLRDYVNQPADVCFVIDELLALPDDDPLAGHVDGDAIAAAGHSLGAITTIGVGLNSCCDDDRLDAAVELSGIRAPFPDGEFDDLTRVPFLAVHGAKDSTVPVSGSDTLFADAPGPAAYLRLPDGDHAGYLSPGGPVGRLGGAGLPRPLPARRPRRVRGRTRARRCARRGHLRGEAGRLTRPRRGRFERTWLAGPGSRHVDPGEGGDRGGLRAPAPRDPRPHGGADPPRGGGGRAGRRRAHPRRRRRLLLRLDGTGLRTGVDGRVPRAGAALRRQHRDGRQLVPPPRRPRGRRHRRGQVPGRAHHAGRAAAHRRPAPGWHRSHRGRPGVGLRAGRHHQPGGQLRARGEPAHARVRHDQRAAGVDQGRGVRARPAQPARAAPEGRHRRRRARLADGGRPAPPPRLLRRHRRRRRPRGRAPGRGPRARSRRRVGARPRRGA